MKNVHKLALLLLGCLALISVDAGRSGAQDAEGRTITLATLAPPGSTWMRVFDSWNRELRRRTERGLQFRIYSGGVQGDESEVIRKIRGGRLDATAVTAVGLSQIYRPALVFSMPGLIDGYAQLDRARDAMAAEMDRGFEGAGFHLLGWGDVGQSRIFSTGPVTSPGDYANRHPWMWTDDNISPHFYEIVRSNPVRLQLPEVLGAIQTGRVDMVTTPPVSCIALQWCSRMTHMTDEAMSIVLGATVISQATWNALTADQRTAMSETGLQFHQLARRNLRRDETQALETLRARADMTVVTLTPAQRQEWDRIGQQVRQRLIGVVADQALVDRVAAAVR